MKEWSFDQFLEESWLDSTLDTLTGELREEIVSLLRKAYHSGYGKGMQFSSEWLNNQK